MELQLIHICDLPPSVPGTQQLLSTVHLQTAPIAQLSPEHSTNMFRLLLLGILCIILFTEYSGKKISFKAFRLKGHPLPILA